MNQNHPSLKKAILQSLQILFPGVSSLQLSDDKFNLQQLTSLQLYVRYCIPYINYPENVKQFYLKVSDFYWDHQMNLRQSKQLQQNELHNIQTDEQIVKLSIQLNNLQMVIKQSEHFIQNFSLKIAQANQTNKIQQNEQQLQRTQQIYLPKKRNFRYEQIMNKIELMASQQYQGASKEIIIKTKELNEWMTIEATIKGFSVQKQQNNQKLKIQTNINKVRQDKRQVHSPRIIIGKNQSVQTRQIKHQLKLKAKESYAENKQKQELLMNQLEKIQIQLTFLLNVITPQFFNDFYQQIKTLILSNQNCIPMLCEKIIFKVKQQHNFINIYLHILKKLTKIKKVQFSTQHQMSRFNCFHRIFVEIFQTHFAKLLLNQECLNENIYKKQLKGYCIFMGKLIQNKIISKNIFKMCFWDILFKFISNYLGKQQIETINECLLEGIFIIAQNMGKKYFQLTKLNAQLHSTSTSKNRDNDQIFQQIKQNILNTGFKNILINQIHPIQYLNILKIISSSAKSQRRKIQFLIKNLQERTQENLKDYLSQNKILQQKLQSSKKQIFLQANSSKEQLKIMNRKISEIIDIIMEESLTKLSSWQILQKIQKSDFKLDSQSQNNYFIQNFLMEFADSNKIIVLKRSQIFIQLMQTHALIQQKYNLKQFEFLKIQ